MRLRRLAALALLLGLLPSRGSSLTPVTPRPTVPSLGPWVATLVEDFASAPLNTSLWRVRQNESHCEPCEPQLYVESALTVANSTLVITTSRAHVLGPGGVPYNWTSGWVDTSGSFAQRYGIFEVRARLPSREAANAWPAHWLLPASDECWPPGGEVDIMEAAESALPALGGRIFGSYRWGTACGGDRQPLPGAAYPPLGEPPIDWSASFHTFSVWWNASALSFYVDGTWYETKTSAEVVLPTSPMYIILNTAVAWFLPPPGPNASYPATHEIEWVQVWAEA